MYKAFNIHSMKIKTLFKKNQIFPRVSISLSTYSKASLIQYCTAGQKNMSRPMVNLGYEFERQNHSDFLRFFIFNIENKVKFYAFS